MTTYTSGNFSEKPQEIFYLKLRFSKVIETRRVMVLIIIVNYYLKIIIYDNKRLDIS